MGISAAAAREILSLLAEMEGAERRTQHDPSRFVSIDFETATSSRGSACSLGLAVVEHGEVTETKSWLIRPPGNRYDSANISIHGIRPADTAKAPVIGDLWDEIEDRISGSLVVAHNAAFDMYVLRESLMLSGIPTPPLRYGCTLCLARKALNGVPNHRLDTVCEHLGVSLLNHHEAQADAVACARIAIAIAEISGVPTIADALAKHGLGIKTLAPR